jgi:capsular polysaccharide biosynthesis protein
MEIAEYLRIIRKRIWVVVLIPVLAVAVAIPLVLSRPARYAATATVAGPLLTARAPGSPYRTSNGAQQFVADFVAAVSIPSVVDATAQTAHAPQDEIRSNSSATPIGQSSLVEVRYESTDASSAGAVVKELSLQTLEYLLRPAADAVASSLPDAHSDPALGPVERLDLLLLQPETISVSSATMVSRAPELIRASEVAIATGVLLAILVVILLEVLPSPGRRKRKVDESTKVLEETAA